MDLPRSFTIRERSHRIINPLTAEKVATFGEALFFKPGMTILDLACGKGELLSTWSRDHGIRGTGVDISSVFIREARERAVELGVDDNVSFVHGDASDFVSGERVDIASCWGATWIGDGVPGTIALLEKSLKSNGVMLIGHPYWRMDPPDQATVEGCYASSRDEYQPLHGQIRQFQELGWDVIEMMIADQDSWDRYAAAQWMNIRSFIDENPGDDLTPEFREELTRAPVQHTQYQREYLGWGVFALKKR